MQRFFIATGAIVPVFLFAVKQIGNRVKTFQQQMTQYPEFK